MEREFNSQLSNTQVMIFSALIEGMVVVFNYSTANDVLQQLTDFIRLSYH